jgi:hypothetical protein
MKSSKLLYILLAAIGLKCSADSKSAAIDQVSINVARELETLAQLEASPLKAPQDKDYGQWALKTTTEAIRIIESNQLSTGDEFFRISKFVLIAENAFLVSRVRYELLLSAAALGNTEAEKQLAVGWDELMHSLGQPLRTDFEDLAQKQPEFYLKESAPARVTAVLREPSAARRAAKAWAINPELKSIVDADQADRRNWAKLSDDEKKSAGKRDRQRNKRIQEIVAAEELNTAADFANAALVMQHSASFPGYQTAHELAVCSLLLGDRGLGRWLVTATYDRLLRSVGHRQRFGTQYISLGGPIVLVQVDANGICDAQRKALGCPSLEQARNRNQTRAGELTNQVAEFTQLNGRIRDPKFGIDAKLPEGWTLRQVHRWGDQQTTLFFGIDSHPDTVPSFYYQVFHKRKTAISVDLTTLAQEEIKKKQSSRQDTASDYTNRTDSLKRLALGENTAFSWIADFTNPDGEKYAEYFIRLRTESADTLFFVKAPAADIDEV